MAKSIIVEGKTSTEAIEKGLKELKVSKDKVDIKILENEENIKFIYFYYGLLFYNECASYKLYTSNKSDE